MTHLRTLTPAAARRLAISRQHLANHRQPPTASGILQVVRDIRCVQLDPISVVARSHTLVIFSRVGTYDPQLLNALLYKDRLLFEYWAHAASIVLTEDYPIHRLRMRTYARTTHPWHQRIAQWVEQNKSLRDYILREIKRKGPLPSRYLTEHGQAPESWVSSGWTNDRNVSRMLDFLWMQGKIMPAGRQGLQKYWDLSSRVLPDWTPQHKLDEKGVVRAAAQLSLRALGVANARQIQGHFISGGYPSLPARLNELEQEGLIERVRIEDRSGHRWDGTWYVHSADLALIDQLSRNGFEGRTVLLSPFDNLIRDRARTRQFWDFDYAVEIYTPKHKRKYGYYVMPILYGDRLIGRIDPTMDRSRGVLTINAVHTEKDAPRSRETAQAVRDAIEELGEFLGAGEIVYSRHAPQGWRRTLTNQ